MLNVIPSTWLFKYVYIAHVYFESVFFSVTVIHESQICLIRIHFVPV